MVSKEISSRESALKPVVEKDIEIYASKPDIQGKDAAEMLGVSENTLYKLRRDPNFWSRVYDYYMVTFEGDIVGVLKAAVREALAGNVQAMRLTLEHSGKLQKHLNITILSPFEKWMEKGDVEDAEVLEEFNSIKDNFDDLPPSLEEKGTWRDRNEHIAIRNATTKEESRIRRNEARKIMRSWLKRANAVGVEPLPPRRPTPGQRRAWEKEIKNAEKAALEQKPE